MTTDKIIKHTFLEYDLDGNKNPIALTNEGKWYLCLIYSAVGKPEKAMKIFQTMPQSLSLSNESQDFLKKIVYKKTVTNPNEAQTIAIALHAAIILLKHTNKKPINQIQKLLTEYQSLRNHVKECALSNEDFNFLCAACTKQNKDGETLIPVNSWDHPPLLSLEPTEKQIQKLRDSNPPIYSVSWKSLYHFEKPFNIYQKFVQAIDNDDRRFRIALRWSLLENSSDHVKRIIGGENYKFLFTALHWKEIQENIEDFKGMNLPLDPNKTQRSEPPFDKASIEKIAAYFENKLTQKRRDEEMAFEAARTTLTNRKPFYQEISEKLDLPSQPLPLQEPFTYALSTEYTPPKQSPAIRNCFNSPKARGKITAELSWPNQNSNRFIAKEQAEIQKLFNEGKTARETELVYTLKTSIDSCKKAIKTELENLEKTLVSQKEEILNLANKLPETEELARLQQLLLDSKFKKQICLDQLITAFLENRPQAYQMLNPHLTKQEIENIDKKIRAFLIKSNEKDRLARALLQNEDNLIGKEINANFEYNPENDENSRVLLVFEHRANMTLRKKQVELIKNMLKTTSQGCYEDCLGELLMGQGKTSVLTSILLQLAAKKGRIAFFIPPAPQFATIACDLAERQKKNFYKEMIAMNFERKDLMKIETLKQVLSSFQEAKEHQKVILITPETVESFALELEVLLKKNKVSQTQNDKERITLLNAIIEQMETDGDALFDEAHQVLAPQNRLIFTHGNKRPISSQQADIVEEILSLHLTSGHFSAILNNEQSSFGKERYIEEILPRIQGGFFDKNKDLIPYKQMIIGTQEMANIPDNLLQKAKTAKETFQYLPLVLEKTAGQRYGRAINRETVIPYAATNDPTTKEFGSAVESALYHFLLALAPKAGGQRILKTELQSFITRQVRNAQEINLHQKTPFSDTEPAQTFLRITGFKLSECADGKNIDAVLSTINGDFQRVLQFEKEVILRTVGSFAEYHSFDAQRLWSLFNTKRAMTGTPKGKDSLPISLQGKIYKDLGRGEALCACLEKEEKVHYVKANIKDILDKTQMATGLIDSAGILKEGNNEQIARQILALSPSVTGLTGASIKGKITELGEAPKKIQTVLFFNEAGELCALKQKAESPIYIGSTNPQEIEKHGINLASTYVLFDDRHAEGTDIVQEEKAENAISINHKMTLDRLLQGVLRLRKFLQEQTATYIINDLEKHHFGDNPKILSILETAVTNQANEKVKESATAYKQKIDCVFTHKLFALARKEGSLEKYKSFFVHEEGETLPEDLLVYANQRLNDFNSLVDDVTTQTQVKKDIAAILEEMLSNDSYYQTGGQERAEAEVEIQTTIELSANLETVIEQEIAEERSKYVKISEVSFYQEKDFSEEITMASKLPDTPREQVESYSLETLLQHEVYDPKHNYASLFKDLNLYATSNFCFVRNCHLPVFSVEQKQAKQILFRLENNQLQAFLLSSQEAARYLEKNPDAQVFTAEGTAYGTATIEKEHQEKMKELLWHINFFDGNVDYLLRDLERTKNLMENPLRQRFLSLKVSSDPFKKKIFNDALKIFHP